MNHRIVRLVLLASASALPVAADVMPVPVAQAPQVISAVYSPTDVQTPAMPDPEVWLRLKDPVKGGVLRAFGTGEGLALLPGPVREGRFKARVGIEFLEPNTEVEVRVIDADGVEVNAVVLSSAASGRWSGDLCDVEGSGSAQVTMHVRKGSALGTAYRLDPGYVTTIPVLSRAAFDTAGGGTAAFSRALAPSVEPQLSALSTGSSSYTDHHNWPGTSFRFVVAGGPPNTCGDIHTLRNGSWIVTNDWLCTDATGYGVKGPWSVTTTMHDQKDDPTYIVWDDQTSTTETWHVIDTTRPTVGWNEHMWKYYKSTQGTAVDSGWGSCFNKAWTKVQYAIRNDAYLAYWDTTSGCGPYSGGAPRYCFTAGWPVWYDAATDLPVGETRCQMNWLAQPFYTYNGTDPISIVVRVNDIWSTTEQWKTK